MVRVLPLWAIPLSPTGLLLKQRQILCVSLIPHLTLLDKLQCSGIDAVAQSGGGRAILEQMPKMGSAIFAL